MRDPEDILKSLHLREPPDSLDRKIEALRDSHLAREAAPRRLTVRAFTTSLFATATICAAFGFGFGLTVGKSGPMGSTGATGEVDPQTGSVNAARPGARPAPTSGRRRSSSVFTASVAERIERWNERYERAHTAAARRPRDSAAREILLGEAPATRRVSRASLLARRGGSRLRSLSSPGPSPIPTL